MPGWQKASPKTFGEMWALQAFLDLHFHTKLPVTEVVCAAVVRGCASSAELAGTPVELNYPDGENN